MTLATRCESCGTTFRVVQDQLRASDGWVRCGRCDVVFDAMQSLIDLEASAAETQTTATRSASTVREQPPEPLPTEAQRLAIDSHRVPDRLHDDDVAGALNRGPEIEAPLDREAEPAAIPAMAPVGAAPATTPRAFDHQPDGVTSPDAQARSVHAPPLTASGTAQAPAFMRDADRQARWDSPAMRAALLGSSLILLLMLLMQIVYHRRDSIAAHSPASAAWLQRACERWNCRIEPLRRVNELSIESSALSKVAGQPQAVRLTMTLRNRGPIDLALPAVELSLTDAEGQLIARRALLPADFKIEPPIVPGSAALPLQLVLSTRERQVAGYTVELFYP